MSKDGRKPQSTKKVLEMWSVSGGSGAEPEAFVFSPDGERYHTLSELAELSGYNTDYLRQLAERGLLEARRIGPKFRGYWITTKAALQDYQEQKDRNSVGGPRKARKSVR